MRKSWVVVLCAVAAVVYFLFNPSCMAWFPKCPFLMLTGFKCPGCGSQRAVHCLLHGDVAGAAGYNFLLVFSIPILAVLFYAEWCRTSRPRLYSAVHRLPFVWGYFALVLLWGVVRNVWGW